MSEEVKKLELKKKAKKPMIFVINVLNSNLTILEKGKKKKMKLKKQLHRKPKLYNLRMKTLVANLHHNHHSH